MRYPQGARINYERRSDVIMLPRSHANSLHSSSTCVRADLNRRLPIYAINYLKWNERMKLNCPVAFLPLVATVAAAVAAAAADEAARAAHL